VNAETEGRLSGKPPNSGGSSASKRPRGRPKGSVALTREIEEKILTLIGAGAYDYVAAEAAGVAARTLREWLARGEGRSERGSTPKLRAFARKVRTAKALARVDAEVRVFRENPKLWLSRVARTRGDREGWGEQGSREPDDTPRFSLDLRDYADETARAELYRVHEVMLGIEPAFVIPACLDASCPCIWHAQRTGALAERAAAGAEGGQAA